MTTSFIPHTPQELAEMLNIIGVDSVDALFSALPDVLKVPFTADTLPNEGMDELSLQQVLIDLAAKNKGTQFAAFLGGGAYHRFIPPAVNTIASRSEFYTAYTPYQPEVSQGTLQMVYEFQTMMSELTGMDVTNASVYDGATALCEAALMALRATRRSVLYLSQTIHPQYRQVLQTYVDALGDIELCDFDPHAPFVLGEAGKSVAAIVVQQPDYYGVIHDFDQGLNNYQAICKATGALLVVSVDPMTLGVLEPPRSFGADIVCGDIQQFGNNLNFGGPYGGFISTIEKYTRQLPGRLVGRSVDRNGKTAYTLTLQTREQHIRRDKATSNICTNQSLNILKATVYMSLVGPHGLKQLAAVSAERAHFLADALLALPNVTLRYQGAFLYEFALTLPIPARQLISQMVQQDGILAGIDLGKYWAEEEHTLLVAVTEMNSWHDIHRYIDGFKAALGGETTQTQMEAHRMRKRPLQATGTWNGQLEDLWR